MDKTQKLINEISLWLKDFEKLQPRNLKIDELTFFNTTFEGSAYYLLLEAKKVIKKLSTDKSIDK